jgi:hypothetical protein
MRVLNEREYGLLERLVSLSQTELHKTLGVYLKGKYKNIIIEKEYIVAIGDIPIALVAHMDTVFYNQPGEVYYDQRKGVLWSPDGLGADDRAGIFAIIQIIQSGLRPSIILTTDEERGGLGAQKLAKKECPIPGLKYMIELDRKGSCDCVFYDCANPQFIQYIEKFGFIERTGSFSDISFLMSAWKICGVNLSIGYQDEHSIAEILNIGALYRTVDIVKRMLQSTDIPKFNYVELSNKLTDYYKNTNSYENYDMGMPCECCGKFFFEFELIPVKGHKTKEKKYYCSDCIVDRVNWCDNCGQAYEMNPVEDMDLCEDCLEVLNKC